jgi:non-heme chloroperoxidase
MCTSVGVKGALDCITAFSETDLTEDLKRFDVPTLIIHGDDDQIVPIGASALMSSQIIKDATLMVYPGAPHGLARAPPSRTPSTPTCWPSSRHDHHRAPGRSRPRERHH